MGDSSLPRTIADVATPCLLVDIVKVKRNAQAMIDRCKKLGVQLRPHVKTHKCLEIGEISTGYTKRGIVVSTLSEAEMFADGGFDDIIFAQLFTQDKLLRMSRLAARLNIFHVIVDNEVSVQLLEDNPLTNSKWSVLVKVDCGGSRAGVPWDSDTAINLAKRLSHNTACTFRGIYCHEGQSYKARGFDEVEQVSSQTAERILELANR
jgi:D-serine deaminase-like pyridoxal phosphate-dependent protein